MSLRKYFNNLVKRGFEVKQVRESPGRKADQYIIRYS